MSFFPWVWGKNWTEGDFLFFLGGREGVKYFWGKGRSSECGTTQTGPNFHLMPEEFESTGTKIEEIRNLGGLTIT